MSQGDVCSKAHIDRMSIAALSSGALQPIATEQITLTDHGLPFVVKWVSSLLAKPRRQKPAGSPSFNPFLPPEGALTLGALAPDHLLVLNKFPVMPHHLLVITRHFEAQTDPLNAGDFAALARLIDTNGGLGFYNGGETAGASQPHKHLQWIPDLPPLAQLHTRHSIFAMPSRHSRPTTGRPRSSANDSPRAFAPCAQTWAWTPCGRRCRHTTCW